METTANLCIRVDYLEAVCRNANRNTFFIYRFGRKSVMQVVHRAIRQAFLQGRCFYDYRESVSDRQSD
jgi:hypothetical protein